MSEIRNSSLRIDVNHFHFIWVIDGFNEIPFISKHPLRSPSFSLNDNSETLWQLVMAKEIRSKVVKDDILIFKSTGGLQTIKDTNDTEPEKAVGFTMVKLESESQTWEVVKYHVQIKVGETTFRTKEKIENGESYDEADGLDYIFASDLKESPLFDEVKLTIEVFIEHKLVDRPLVPATIPNRKNFTENLISLLKNQKYADIILKAGDCEIAAHKCILSSRTYGLEHHFAIADDLENPVQSLDLGFEDEYVAEAFLIYAYCGRIPEEFPIEKYSNLYEVAEKFKADELKTLVKDLLKHYLNTSLCSNCNLGSESVLEMCAKILDGKVETVQLKKCSHCPKE